MAPGLPPMTASPRKQASQSSSSKPSARALAYSILLSVETEAAYASELLHSRLEANLDAREAALATELVMGTLRWQGLLDFLIERYAARKTAALDREVLVALRLGIYQLRYLTRMPARAAVSESVELVKRGRKKSAAALVNAALRRAAAEKDEAVSKFVAAETGAAEALAIAHSHPAWLVERWLRAFGKERTIALMETNNRTPEHACAVFDVARRDETMREFGEAGIAFEPGRLLRGAIVVKRGNIAKTRAFRNGWIGAQDEASQMVPLLLGAKRGDSVLDLCAAPGGKTMALARMVGDEGRVVAADFYPARLRVMCARLQMAGAANVSLVALDGTKTLPFAGRFDCILVDAPCSGTGTLARNPEIRWRLKAGDLADLHRRQVALVESALEHLGANGALLYSTCSLEAEENELVVREALAANPGARWEAVKIPQGVLADGVKETELIGEDGAFRTFPPTHRTDGFFAALIRRR
jgi:16S rRNA (cytosine967-C5)-methyltransferase